MKAGVIGNKKKSVAGIGELPARAQATFGRSVVSQFRFGPNLPFGFSRILY
jgi:hypothetical protein